MQNDINQSRLTALAYIMYFFAGSTVILPGVLMSHIADTFHVEMATIGSAYSSFGFGILISIILGGYLTRHLGLKKQVVAICILLAGTIFSICTYQTLEIFRFSIFTLGLCCGLFIAAANFLLVNLYDDTERHSKLIRLDFLFSFGSLLYPILASRLLTNGLPWYHIYTSVFIIGAVIFLMTITARFPNFDQIHKAYKEAKAQDKANNTHQSFPFIHVLIVALACFAYTSSEVSFSFWVIDYIQGGLERSAQTTSAVLGFLNNFGITANTTLEMASVGLSIFWTAVALGRFLSSYIIEKVSFERFTLASILLAIVSFYAMLQATGIDALFTLIAIMGLGYASLYPSIISHGTLIVKRASPRLVAFYLTAGTLGFMTAAEFSSSIQNTHGSKYALICSLFFLLVVLSTVGLSFLICKTQRLKQVVIAE